MKHLYLPAHKLHCEPAVHGLQELLNDVHCIIEAMIGRGSDVALRKPEMYGIPPVLLGDPDRVRGILLNLSTNAAKFTKKGHITMKVRGLSFSFLVGPLKDGAMLTAAVSLGWWPLWHELCLEAMQSAWNKSRRSSREELDHFARLEIDVCNTYSCCSSCSLVCSISSGFCSL